MIISSEFAASDASRGLRLHRMLCRPESGPVLGRAVVLHGLGDHLGCHRAAMELLCDRGYVCAGFDAPGHGKSEGRRGHIDGVESLFGVIEETVGRLDAIVGPVGPRLLYAHSTGAFYALVHLLAISMKQGSISDQTLFDRIWLSSPLLRPDHGQNRFLIAAAEWLSRLIPGVTLDTGVRPERCRRLVPGTTPDEVERLCHCRVSVALGASLLRHARDADAAAERLRDPADLLITQGADDTICPPAYSRAFFDRVPATRKRYVLLPGTLHEPLREPDNGPILAAAGRWLDGGDAVA
ncbi:MAG: alpha/beta fold hydrolase [Verrucomicrobiales bacterium]|nr:alpha/beta fold hydrolase [Verrucomicrobiales bacterium]